MQKMDVSERIFDVRCEVTDLSLTAGTLEVIVDPANEYLFRRQHHQVVECFVFLQQSHELLVLNQVDDSQQTNLPTVYNTTES